MLFPRGHSAKANANRPMRARVRGPKDHMNVRILQTIVFEIIRLRTRVFHPYVHEAFGDPDDVY